MKAKLVKRLRAPAVVAAGALACVLQGAPALAQDSDLGSLVTRLDRMQRELNTLQQHLYRGRPPAPRGAGAPAAAADLDERIAARMEVRLTQLENELRTVTGRSEELSHAVRMFNSRLEKLVSDVDRRLTALEQARPPPQQGAAERPPSAPAAAAATPPSAPGTLGVLPRSAVAQGARAAAPATANAKATPKEQYDRAISLMLHEQDFNAAEKAFREFIADNPEHALAGNAHYWLAETFYVRKNYKQAAFAFADGYRKFPDSRKAADNLLKLGMSLGQLGQNKEACTTYTRLLDNFPNATRSVKAKVNAQQRRLKCR